MARLTELNVTTPRREGQKVVIDLVDRDGRASGHAMEVSKSGHLRLVRVLTVLTEDLEIRSSTSTLFRMTKALSKGERGELRQVMAHAEDARFQSEAGQPARRLARDLFDRLLAAIEGLSRPLTVAPGLELHDLHQLLEAALANLTIRIRDDDSLHPVKAMSVELSDDGPNDPNFFLEGCGRYIDPASDLPLAIHAILRVYRPTATRRRTSRTGKLATTSFYLSVRRPEDLSAHRRLAAARRLAKFWRDHPEVGTPQALATPALQNMTPLERFILALPEIPAPSVEIVRRSGDPRLGVHSSTFFGHLAGKDGVLEEVGKDRFAILPTYRRGPGWQRAVDRLLGGIDPAQALREAA